MVHERDPGSDSNWFDGGGAGRVGWLGSLDQDGIPAAAAGADRAAGSRGFGDAGDCAIGRLHNRHGEQVVGALRRKAPRRSRRDRQAGCRAAQTGKRILAVLDGSPPAGYARWTASLIAGVLGDVPEQYVWRFLRAQKIDLAGRKTWCVSHDPEFAAKAAEIVGLYLDPPEGALVIAVDEKPHIRALERAQGYLKLPNGRALGGQAHDFKRHGTSTQFAALDVTNGEVVARHYQRRRRIEFLDFMNRILTARPFAWTKSEVHQKRLKPRFADL